MVEIHISIHAPREGGDFLWTKTLRRYTEFQSTPPARGATEIEFVSYEEAWISIHAPREGGDALFSKLLKNF